MESCGPVTEIIESSGEPPLEGEGIVEFRLLYRGELKSYNKGRNPRAPEKHLIRRGFHKQLKELWQVQPSLKTLASRTIFAQRSLTGKDTTQLEAIADNYSKCGFRFVPLVTEAINVGCELDILFLRREKPGKVVHRGDIDNRMKLLFDALRMPDGCNEVAGESPSPDEDPFYVLLQDDSLLTKVTITTDRLLTPQDDPLVDDVEVVVGVKTKVLSVRSGVQTEVSNLEYL
jgi:hypothetical protein